ncbi:hypothetical protein DL98DRAFT_570950 [Cadophora sp. DSE1049]|nr:hypothetical protein DL98DRAFT_570950 [Cadophora sp. DSE1049]
MQISNMALMKLLLFLLATTPNPVAAGVVPQSANPPSCSDIAWDEHYDGFQSRICTEPHSTSSLGTSQGVLTKRSNSDIVDQFDSIFSSLTPNTTETNINDCSFSTNTTAISNDDNENQAQNYTEASDIANSNSTLQRRETCAARTLPYRSQLMDLPETSSKSWCFRPGPTPNKNDITSLCRNVGQLKYFGARESSTLPFHDDYVVQRAKTSSPSSTTTAGMTRDNTTVAVEAGGSCVRCLDH